MRHIFILYCCSSFLLFAGSVCGTIYNGGFEISEWSECGDFAIPSGWVCENYTAVDSNFVPPANPENGHNRNWEIDTEAGLFPFEGESFVILSTGDLSPSPVYARISQRVEFFAGQRFSGAYFFGTYDYLPYNDYGAITLEPADGEGRSILLVNVDLGDVGDYGSTAGWEVFEHVFSAEEAGEYDLVISVNDVGDAAFTSYFAVDGLEVCRMPDYGDVNLDCRVDMEDFAFLSADWMCYEPNTVSDPNLFRQYETDFDGSHFVDCNDLLLMADYWLY